MTSAKTTLIICPLPPAPVGVGSQTPLPPVWKVLSSTKSAMGIDTFCQPAPLTISVPVGATRSSYWNSSSAPSGVDGMTLSPLSSSCRLTSMTRSWLASGLIQNSKCVAFERSRGRVRPNPPRKPGVLKRLPQLASMDWLPGTGGLSPTTVDTWPPAEGPPKVKYSDAGSVNSMSSKTWTQAFGFEPPSW